MDQVAITYPTSTLTQMSGSMVKTVLEDIADNLFNPDPYYQQGGDMVRVGGLEYTCDPTAPSGQRITDMRLNGRLVEADKTYKVAGWAPVAEGAEGPAIWDVMEDYFKAHPVIKTRKINTPKVVNMVGNPGIA